MAIKSNEKKKRTSRDFSQVQVINRAAAILRALRDNGALNLSQLARTVTLARSTVFRIVATLEAEGLVTTAGPGGQIQLGTGLVSLGAAVRSDMRHELRPYLEELSLKVDETVDLAILEKDHLVFLDQVAKPQRLRAVSGVGITFPLYCTANGKALLATLPEEEVRRLVPEKFQIFTSTTLRTRTQLLEELQTIRLAGVAYDREEHTPGICAVGAVVCGPLNGSAALSIPVPSVRFTGNEEKLAEALIETCESINLRFRLT
jgi:DNA-binding IclR family transcriptional regulator